MSISKKIRRVEQDDHNDIKSLGRVGLAFDPAWTE